MAKKGFRGAQEALQRLALLRPAWTMRTMSPTIIERASLDWERLASSEARTLCGPEPVRASVADRVARRAGLQRRLLVV